MIAQPIVKVLLNKESKKFLIQDLEFTKGVQKKLKPWAFTENVYIAP